VIHIHGDDRLSTLVRLFGEEANHQQAGRELILERLVELLLVESLRATPAKHSQKGLLRGLADRRIAEALRQMHAAPERSWTVEQLARKAGLSRSAFFGRFTRTVGLRPMEYLVTWRMAVAKDLLRQGSLSLDEVARRAGYGSASTFSTAFSRHVGQPPGRYARTAE
jgi:transcriptional regulator GlxA family with amidase domain